MTTLQSFVTESNRGRYLLIDLETLSLKSTAHILSIGALVFDSNGPLDSYYSLVDWSPYRDQLSIDDSTWIWWQRRSDGQETLYSGTRNPPNVVIENLNSLWAKWCDSSSMILGYSGSFDLPILENWISVHGGRHPWSYRNHGCLRTMIHLGQYVHGKPAEWPAEHVVNEQLSKLGVPASHKHNALYDCMAEYLAFKSVYL